MKQKEKVVMLRFFSLTVVIAIVAVISWGCADSAPTAPANATSQADPHEGHDHADGELDTTTLTVAKYCGGCGELKGTDACCAADAEECAGCGLHKGSALCCVEVDAAAAGKDLCAKCGNVAGDAACCAADAETCADCGLAKGSTLCCKLTKEE